MRKTSALFLYAVVALCAGCETMPKKTAVIPSPPAPPALAPISGTDLDQANLEKVRVGETLKSYPIGRYVDPKDPNVMHEAHVVYRKEAGADWNVERLRPYVDHILHVFGPRRVIWGSDWPVLNLAANYGEWIAASERLLAGLDETSRRLVFALNAQRFYRLD